MACSDDQAAHAVIIIIPTAPCVHEACQQPPTPAPCHTNVLPGFCTGDTWITRHPSEASVRSDAADRLPVVSATMSLSRPGA